MAAGASSGPARRGFPRVSHAGPGAVEGGAAAASVCKARGRTAPQSVLGGGSSEISRKLAPRKLRCTFPVQEVDVLNSLNSEELSDIHVEKHQVWPWTRTSAALFGDCLDRPRLVNIYRMTAEVRLPHFIVVLWAFFIWREWPISDVCWWHAQAMTAAAHPA